MYRNVYVDGVVAILIPRVLNKVLYIEATPRVSNPYPLNTNVYPNGIPFIYLAQNCTPFLYLKDKPKQEKTPIITIFLRAFSGCDSVAQRMHAFMCLALSFLP